MPLTVPDLAPILGRIETIVYEQERRTDGGERVGAPDTHTNMTTDELDAALIAEHESACALIDTDRVEPDVAFVREVHNGAHLRMHDGREVEFWSFNDPFSRDDKPFPSPMIRVREGQIVHTTLIPSMNTHTIHHHGIEPTPHNDGVGHTSFEVKDHYTYQWRPAHAGTYFYHCHKNTVLHFEMGMYGPLVVDPPEGPGYVRRGTEIVPYDHEVLWIPDDVEPDWHDHSNHSNAVLRSSRCSAMWRRQNAVSLSNAWNSARLRPVNNRYPSAGDRCCSCMR